MLRTQRLESRDLSLTASMIPLGSCTMKLNRRGEMFPCRARVRRRFIVRAHQADPGYPETFWQLETWLAENHRVRRAFAPTQSPLTGRNTRIASSSVRIIKNPWRRASKRVFDCPPSAPTARTRQRRHWRMKVVATYACGQPTAT